MERIGGDHSLSGFFVDQVKKAVRSSELTNLLSIDQSSCKHTAPAIGKARAKEIVVNVLLPFATALGLLNGDIALARNARKAFFEFLMLSKKLTDHRSRGCPVGRPLDPANYRSMSATRFDRAVSRDDQVWHQVTPA